MEDLKTLVDYEKAGLDLKITCRWCGTIRDMCIADAIEAAQQKRGGGFTHLSAFAEEVTCSRCGFKKAIIEPYDPDNVPGRPATAGLADTFKCYSK